MLISLPLTLDIDKGDERFSTLGETIELRQGDALAYVLDVSIREKGQVLDLTGRAVRLYAVLPDGSTVIDGENVEVVSAQDGSVQYTVPPELTSRTGEISTAYFRITDESAESAWAASTPNVPISVRKGVSIRLRDGDYLPEFDGLMADGQASVARLDGIYGELVEGEAARVAGEDERRAAESLRVISEEARQLAEIGREDAEAERQAAEEDRCIAELARDDAEALRTAKFADMEQRSRGWLRYICREGEYDPGTRQPTVESPDTGTMYFVPSQVGTEQSAYQEWIWVSEDARWESFGEVELSITPVSPEQLTAVADGTDGGEGGSEVVTLTGWRLAWSLIKGAFAAIVHKHSASDITSGSFGSERIASGAVGASQLASNAVTTAKIADNQVTSAKLDSTLRDSISQVYGKNSNLWFRKHGKVVVMGGFYQTATAQTVTLYTMPEGCRPPSYTAAPTASGGYAEVGSDGVVKVVAKASGANYFTLCYPIA